MADWLLLPGLDCNQYRFPSQINGLNISETANLLNITEANAKVRLNRAKTMLRGEIEKTYSETELFEFNLKYCDGIGEDVMRAIGEL